MLFVAYGISKNRKKTKKLQSLRKLKLSKIESLKSGLCKVSGSVDADALMTSLLTKSKCVGYKYEEKQWKSRRPYDNGHEKKWWKTITSETECLDFWIEDDTGKIKVSAFEIAIYCAQNKKNNKKQKGKFHLFEELLLPDEGHYTVIGSVTRNEDNELVIEKDPIEKKLYIFDDFFVKTALKIPLAQKIGCGLFLLGCIGIVIYFLFFN